MYPPPPEEVIQKLTNSRLELVSHGQYVIHLRFENGNNSFTAIAKDSAGRADTNTVSVNLPSTASFQYDLNGNLIGDGRRRLDYDDENQLMRVVVTNATSSEFVYDGKGRRRVTREWGWDAYAQTWVLTNEVHYVYDGNLVIQERDWNNGVKVTYTRSGGRLLARTDASLLPGPHAYYHADGNGNVTCLINTNQLIVAKYLYDPYGNVLAMSGPLADANLYRFSSKEVHPYSGLIYFGRRFYDPQLQRWVNGDPIQEEGGVNLFAYVGNNPTTGVDPLGLAWYDTLGSSFQSRVDITKQATLDSQGVAVTTIINSAVDVANLFAQVPKQLGHLGEATGRTGYVGDEPLFQPITHLGEGLGTFFGNPTLENSAGAFQDLSVTAGLLTPLAPKSCPARSVAGTKGLGNQNPLFKNALQAFNEASDLSKAGRALTKHPELVDATKATLRQTLRTDVALNEAAHEALKNIMRK